MNLKKILLTSLIMFFNCSIIAAPVLQNGFVLAKSNTGLEVLNIKKIIPSQACYIECDDAYERCMGHIGGTLNGAYFCNYTHLMCVDECEFGRGGF